MQILFHMTTFDPLSFGGQLELMLRLVLAAFCGGLIGFERTKRMKDAGIRTHVVVAIGAAIMMLVSKYGFYDVLDTENLSADAARIAAQVVSGVGFLGAGVIFTKRGGVKGLTTAAGIWATAGIGMAIASGMYAIGLFGTLLVIAVQIVLHIFFKRLENVELQIKLENQPNVIEELKVDLMRHNILVESMELDEREANSLTLYLSVRIPENATMQDLAARLTKNPAVLSFETRKTTSFEN